MSRLFEIGLLALAVLTICFVINTTLEVSGFTHVDIRYKVDAFYVGYHAPICTADEAMGMNLNRASDCSGIEYKFYAPDGDQSDWQFSTIMYNPGPIDHKDADHGMYIFQIRDKTLPQDERVKPENELYYFATVPYINYYEGRGVLDNQVIINNRAPTFAIQDTQYATLIGQEISIPLIINDADDDEIKLKKLKGAGNIEHDNFVWTPGLGDNGTVNDVRIRAYDGKLGYDYVDLQITVINNPLRVPDMGNQTMQKPPAAQNITLGVIAGESVYYYLGNSINDPENGNLTATIIDRGAKGIAEINSFNTFAYAANKNSEGQDVVRYLVTDDNNLTAAAAITMEIEPFDDNVPPAAFDFEITVGEDGRVLFDPLRSELIIDDNGDPLSMTILRQPAVGLVHVNGTIIEYSAPPDSAGQTTDFDYMVDDGRGGNATATVTVNIGRLARIAAMVVDDYVSTTPGTTVAVNPFDNDLIQLPTTSFELGSASWGSKGPVHHDPSSHTFYYTPNAAATGQDKFRYWVRVDDVALYGHVNVLIQPPTQNVSTTDIWPDGIPNRNPMASDIKIMVIADDPMIVRPDIIDPDGDMTRIVDVVDTSIVKGGITGQIVDNTIAINTVGQLIRKLTYTVSDDKGGTDTGDIHIHTVGQWPYITSLSRYHRVNVGETLTFTAKATTPYLDTLTFVLGNGPPGATITPQGEFSWMPTASQAGQYKPKIIVSDSQGNWTSRSVRINVVGTNISPVAENFTIATREDDTTFVNLIQSGFISDENNDPLSVTISRQPVIGTIIADNGIIYYISPPNSDGQTASFDYVVSDGKGGTATATVTINIGQPQQVNITAVDDAINATQGTSITINVLENDIINPPTVNFDVVILQQPMQGSATIQSDGRTILYVPNATATNKDQFVYALRANGVDMPANVTVAIQLANSTAGTILSITLHPVAPLTASEGVRREHQISVSNPDDLSIIWTITSDSLGATITPDGRFVWEPGEEHGGKTHEFNFVATTSTGNTNGNLSVTVAETNQKPVFTTTKTKFTVPVGAPFTLDMNATDADMPEQPILYRILSQSPSGNPATINNHTGVITWTPNMTETRIITVRTSDNFDPPGTADIVLNITALPESLLPNTAPTASDIVIPANQSQTITLDLAARDYISDAQQTADTLVVNINSNTPQTQGNASVQGTTITYRANTNAAGNDTITYIVTDNGGLTTTGTITIMISLTAPTMPSGHPPEAPSLAETTDEDEPVTVAPVIFDPDGGTPAITAVSKPSKGATDHNATAITYSPHRDENGWDLFTYTITDDEGQTATGTINITISPVNDAPVLDPLKDRRVDLETTLAFIVAATDVDDDPLSFAVTGEPPGATINATGYFSWTPTAAQNGSHTFAVAVSDGRGGSDSQNITITVTGINTPPTAQSFVTVVGENDDVFIDLTRVWVIHDADNDPLNLTVSRQPEIGSALANGTTIYYFSPPNSTGRKTSFDYVVSDGRGGSATATVTVDIIDPTQTIIRPVDDTAQTTPGAPIIVNVLDNDIVGPPEISFVLDVLHQPQKGMATVSPSGSTILYTPNTGATGQDTFVYAIRSDGTDRLASVTVTIKSTNAPPVALDVIVNTDEFGDALVDLIAEEYATDEDPDTLAAEILAQGTQGYATAFGSSVYYQSYIGATGIDAVRYGVTDSGGLEDSGRIYIVLPEAGTNQPPTADDFVIDTVSGGTTWIDMFEEGHINDDDPGTIFAYVSIPPTKGSAYIHGTTVIYRVDEGQTGLDVFEYTVADTHEEEASALVAVWITDNTPPVATNIDLEVAAGQAIEVDLLQDGHITDDSQETLTARILAGPSLGSATISPDAVLRYESDADRTGLDVFSYIVTDAHGKTDTALVTVSVLPEPNAAPAGRDIDITAAPGQTISRDIADLVHDPEGGTVIIGISRQASQGAASVSGTVITYTAGDDAAGTDSFGYLLIDDYGAFTSWTVSVTIAEPRIAGAPDQPPAADDFTVYTDRTGATRVDLAGAGHVTDDDISTVTAEILEQARKGRALVLGSSVIIYQADLGESGIDIVRYRVTDLAGATAEGTMVIILQPSVAPPSASGFDIEAVPGQTVEVDLLEEGYISDDRPDTLLVSITIQPTLGTADIIDDTVLRYQADANGEGLAALEYMVTDEDGENATAIVSVSVTAPQVTIAPTAKSISIPTARGQDTQVDLIAEGYATDDDLDELVASIVLQPKLGRATVVDDTIIRYQADDTREGLDVFAYAVTDPDGENATGVVTVSALPGSNMPPTGQDITITVAPGRTVGRDIAGIISDPEGNSITVAVSRQPAQGNASASGTTVSYTARPDAAGADSFGYLLVDEFSASSQWNVTVEISDTVGANPNPPAPNIPANTGPQLPSGTTPGVSGPDRVSTIMAPVSDTAVGSMLEAYLSHGLVVFAGTFQISEDIAGMMQSGVARQVGPSPVPGFDRGLAGFLHTRIMIHVPDADRPGVGIADHALSGVTGQNDIAVLISEIGNVPPVLSPIGYYSINAQETLTFTVSATDFNDTVSYRLSGAPGNAAISEEGIFRWTPRSADEGSHAFMIIAYDKHGAVDSESVTITVLPAETPNESPTAPNVAATVAPDGLVLIIPAISDPDGDPARITRATGNVEGTIMQSDNSIEYTAGPNLGIETIIYNVVDGRGGIATGTITITIQ